MREGEWDLFCDIGNRDAKDRLTALMQHFCACGDANLPEKAFYRISGASEPPLAYMFAFQAFGIEIRGRKALVGSKRTFFVVEVAGENPAPDRSSRTRRLQLELPLLTVLEGDR